MKDVPNGVALLDVTQRGHRTLNVSVHFTDSSHPSVTGETVSHIPLANFGLISNDCVCGGNVSSKIDSTTCTSVYT